MSWTFVLRPREMDEFQSCRRAWDFASRVRQNYIPTTPTYLFDIEKSIRIALAVFYFPAMDDWNRSIVRPLAIQGFHRAMREDRERYEAESPITPEQNGEWQRYATLGEAALNRYFDWAIPEDDFESVLADEDIWVPIADPNNPGLELGTTDQRPIRYFGRIDQLISDPQDEYWIVAHRVVWDDWHADEALISDENALRSQWAVEVSYPQLKVAGTVYNELRIRGDDLGIETAQAGAEVAADDLRDMTKGVRHLNLRRSPLTPDGKELGLPLTLPDGGEVLPAGFEPAGFEPAGFDPAGSAPSGPPESDEIVARAGNEFVRRTHVRRAASSIDAARLRIAEHVMEIRDPAVAVPPNPSVEKCSRCAYAKPCTMLDEGLDISDVMASEFRKRTDEEFEDEGLRWSPNRRAGRASLGGTNSKPQNVNFRWG